MTDNITVKRNELKYYINYTDYKVLYEILDNLLLLTQDENVIRTKGLIRSLYFDTIYDKAFYEKEAGVLNRKKYRLRIYDLDTEKVKFEIKNKFNNQILKETAFISREDTIEVQNENYEVLLKYNNPVLNKAYCDFKKDPHRPVAVIEYIREAFMFPFNDVRITFDKKLKATSKSLDIFAKDHLMKPLFKKGILVMEVKYNTFLPLRVKKLIQVPRLQRSAISKYCIGRMGEYI
ncbi:MAG: polyphosphate polymerase domain-containing protein [Nanoarchaeota archaeon]|nr:polyphosphate polymerase domain-containing protein [Nanoarchaeota archaeon]